MRINIAASHRFHLLDLARELHDLGHEVKFYSYLPSNRVSSYGLNRSSSHSIFYMMLPLLLLQKLFPKKSWPLKLTNIVLDHYLSAFMKPCDVYIALGTVYCKSLKVAKLKYNATVILEWGSKHILEQQRILKQIPGVHLQEDYFINRSIQGYSLSDYIAVSSDHVKQSFIQHGFNATKLIKNAYGVDLSVFGPTTLNEKAFDVIMVGGWSYRKGCDLLSDYFVNSDLTFLHVGPIVDLPFPVSSNMTHVDPVDQKKLPLYYSMARVFVLPSREEGLAMVQCQAVGCGLPIICSKDSGGRDLRIFLEDEKWIVEMNKLNLKELGASITRGLELARLQSGPRSYSKNLAANLSWKAYGERYNINLKNLI